MVALGTTVNSGGIEAGLGRERGLGANVGGQFALGANFQIILCTPINSSTVRVFFSKEPKHVSPLAANDALYIPNWSIVLSSGSVGTTEPVVTFVGNVRNALSTEVDLVVYPEAHSIDVQFDRRIIWNAVYAITAATGMASQDLLDDLVNAAGLQPPTNVCSFPGIHIQRPRRITRATRARTGVDISYSVFDGIFGFEPNNDLATQSGNAALKKRIIRRLLSSPGGFPHLPEYGVGLRLKEALKTTTVSDLRVRVRDQVLQEPEVDDATVNISRPGPDVIVVVVNVITAASNAFPLRFNVPSEGPIRVAA